MSEPLPLPPFKAFLASNIPSVFDNTLSYYDELTKLIAYLEKVIVPAIDKNTEDIQKYVDGLEELKEYVDHYFDNLDVQTEINNKLDAMAEGGQLQTIIAQFLAAAPVFAYGTIAEMAAATNLDDGCIARVIGNTTATNGDGAYYLIRTITGADNPDGLNLVAIGGSLVGVRVVNAAAAQLQTEIDLINSERTILIGDSYSEGTGASDGHGWSYFTKQLLGLTGDDCYILQSGGSGFVNTGAIGNFQTMLSNQYSNISHPETIKRIVVCGGANDWSFTYAQILNNISSFMAYCKTYFPNATVYVGMVGNFNDDSQASHYKTSLKTKVLPAYIDCNKYGAVYLNGVENANHDYTIFYDSVHLTNYEPMGKGVYNALKNGYCSVNYSWKTATTSFASLTDQITFYNNLSNDVSTILTTEAVYNCTITSSSSIDMGVFQLPFVIPAFSLRLPVTLGCYYDDEWHWHAAQFLFDNNDNHFKINIYGIESGKSITKIAIYNQSWIVQSSMC